MWKWMGLFLRKKASFKMLGLTFYSKLEWGCYIISIAKTASKKIGALICSMKFLSPEVALYLYKSTICPCMEYCCHVWAGAPSCYLELLDKLQKRICRTVGLSLAASLEPLAHCRNVVSLSHFYRHTEFCQLWIFPWIILSWHSYSMWDKLGWRNRFLQYLWGVIFLKWCSHGRTCALLNSVQTLRYKVGCFWRFSCVYTVN